MTKLSRGSASAVSIPGLRLRTHSGRVSGASLKGSVKWSQGSSTFQRGSFPPMYISVTWWYFPDHGSIVLEITNERINFLLKFWVWGRTIFIFTNGTGKGWNNKARRNWCVIIKRIITVRIYNEGHIVYWEDFPQETNCWPRLQDSSVMSEYILIISSRGLISAFRRKRRQYWCRNLEPFISCRLIRSIVVLMISLKWICSAKRNIFLWNREVESSEEKGRQEGAVGSLIAVVLNPFRSLPLDHIV